jgi:hypothetical protein
MGGRLFFIVERVSVSMEKCSPYMQGIEDFFCKALKKSSDYFHIFFSKAQLTAT